MSELNDEKPVSKRVKKTTSKKAAAKKTTKKAVKKAVKKVNPKKTVKKTTVKAAKKTTKKAVKRKKVIRNEETTPLQSFYQKTTEVFDNLIEDIKNVPKKTQEFSKNTHFIDNLTNLITQKKDEILKKKSEFTELHALNTTVSNCKKNLNSLYSDLGKECFNCYKNPEADNALLIEISKNIQDVLDTLNNTESKIKDIVNKK